MTASTSLFATQLPLFADLTAAIYSWSTCQRKVVGLAADFADSGEWGATGLASAAHWIARAADIELCTAREWIRVGKKLRVLPGIAAAFEDDEVSYSKVRVLTRLATPDNEQELLAIAATVPAGQLGRAMAAWMNRTSGDAELERHQHDQRSVTWRNEPDGMTTFTMRLPPLVAGTLHAALHTFVMRNQPAVLTLDDWPTLAQQHADGVAALLAAGGADVTTEVVLHVRADGCTFDDGTPIPGSTVERVAPDAFLRALIHDADGRPINASAKRRHPTTRQKRVVKERDRACVDCGASELLEFDHVPDFTVTGHTVVEELELRCAPCHRRRHAAPRRAS
ncbi:MAG: DUF222 domain-containing protein [Actinomycetota bacterium]